MSQNMLPEKIESKIYLVRGQKVMLDEDIAELYGIQTKNLNKAVKRNIERFPSPEFMFQLNQKELNDLRFQTGTSKNKRGGRRYLPYVFTEFGIVMLSSVLSSQRAIEVNIQVVKTFVKLREMISNHKKLWCELKKMEEKNEKRFKAIFEAIRSLQETKVKPKRTIGFIKND